MKTTIDVSRIAGKLWLCTLDEVIDSGWATSTSESAGKKAYWNLDEVFRLDKIPGFLVGG